MKRPVNPLFFNENLGDGEAEKVLIDLVNHMDPGQFRITVQTVWPSPEQDKLHPGIRYRSVYRDRSARARWCYRLDASLGLTYRLHIRDDNDLKSRIWSAAPRRSWLALRIKREKARLDPL